MNRVTIGIPVHAEADRFLATLDAVRRNNSGSPEIIVIPDGASDEIRSLLPSVEARVLEDRGALGGAAALNYLFRSCDADIVVLLESGAIVSPRWLDHLVKALNSSPRAGLAGPSTNRLWNEQAAFPGASGSSEDILRTGLA